MRTILTLTAVLAVGLSVPTSDQDGWASYKAQFRKDYPDLWEDAMRKENFMNSKAKVEKHNALFASGYKSFEMGLNHMSDWTDYEISRTRGLTTPESWKEPIFHEPSGEEVPASVDWRKKNAVTPVKDQGQTCGSCYAFSATGSLEGQIAIKYNRLVALSEQEIIDCPFPGTFGCEGGWPSPIFDDLNRFLHGPGPAFLETEENYPYTGVPQKCSSNYLDSAATDVGHKQVPIDNEEALKEAVANVGPISVVIYTNADFSYYKNGIFDSTPCVGGKHAVLVVGYDKDEYTGQEYWIVKNSWGPQWGDSGYIKMAMGSNLCGIASDATYPVV